MRQYRVHPYTKPAIVDGHPHWAISFEGNELIEVGEYAEAVSIASAMAEAEARASGKDVELLVNPSGGNPARRIVFGGEISWEPVREDDDEESATG